MQLPRPLEHDLAETVRRSVIEAWTIDDTEKRLREKADLWFEKKQAARSKWLGLSKKMAPHKKKIEAKSIKILREMKTACLKKVRKDPTFKKELAYEAKAIDDIVSIFDTSKKRWQTMTSEMADAVSDAGTFSMELLNTDIEFDNLDPRIVDFIENRGLELATSVTGTVKEEVRALLEQGVQEGMTTREVGTMISQYFDEGERYKADRIARTEINAAQARATSEAYRQSDVVTAKEWITAPDVDCDVCEEGEAGNPYDLDADDIPAHPNCVCVWGPVTE